MKVGCRFREWDICLVHEKGRAPAMEGFGSVPERIHWGTDRPVLRNSMYLGDRMPKGRTFPQAVDGLAHANPNKRDGTLLTDHNFKGRSL